MQVPVMAGVITRRLLINYRIAPDVLTRVVPAPFRPQLVSEWGIAGICLIGLRAVRPRGLPAVLGLASENAAHRIAVEWEAHGQTHQGVYIPRRDTSSWVNATIGGRLFPGVHHRAQFTVRETGDRIAVALVSGDGATRVSVEGRVSDRLAPDSVFDSLSTASAFFEQGALGYSAGRSPGAHDGLELRTAAWQVAPLAVTRVASSFFEDQRTFPFGSVRFDCALLMRDVRHEWHARERLSTDPAARAG